MLGEGSTTDTVYVDFSRASGIISNILRDKQRKNSLEKWPVEWPDKQAKHCAPSPAGGQSPGPYPGVRTAFLMSWMMGREQAQQVHTPYKTKEGGSCSGGLCCPGWKNLQAANSLISTKGNEKPCTWEGMTPQISMGLTSWKAAWPRKTC